jgi:hypothetical protein
MNEQDIQTALALLRDVASRLDTITELRRLSQATVLFRTSHQIAEIIREVQDILENAHYNKEYDSQHRLNEYDDRDTDDRMPFNKDYHD